MTNVAKEEESFFNLDEEFGSSEKAEVEGVWVYLGESAQVKVARLANKEAQKAYRKIPKAIRRQIEEGNMSNIQSARFLSKFMASYILRDWKELADAGKLLPTYTTEEGAKFLVKYRRFRDRIWEIANDDDLFNVGELEEDVGNSPARSSGT